MTYRPSNGADGRFHQWHRPERPVTGWTSRLSPAQKAGLYVSAPVLAVFLLCCGVLTAFGVLGGDLENAAGDRRATSQSPAAPESTTAPSVATSSSSAPSPISTPSPSKPTVEKRIVTDTVAIPFSRKTIKDDTLPEGTTKVRTRGVPGVKTVTYEVTITDGVETGKRLVREAITRKPVTEVTAVGTKPESRCHPNYGGCVPIASDVDCAGGSGNGPAYVEGPVDVLGRDVYRLDDDGDGVGCE